MNVRRGVLVLPLAGAALLAVPQAALAATAVTSPGSGSNYQSDTTVPLRASVDANIAADLYLGWPTGTTSKVAHTDYTLTGTTLSYNFGTSNQPNGAYTVTLSGRDRLGNPISDKRTFDLEIPGQRPANL